MTFHDFARPADPLRHWVQAARAALWRVLPGLALTVGIAALAMVLQRASGLQALSPLVLAMGLGMALRNLTGPYPGAAAGIGFSLRRILRFAIVLLGLQLTVQQLAQIGGPGLVIVIVTLAATFVFTKAMGRVLGVDRKLTELIAAGTSICGASAVIATNTVTRGSDENVAYAIACVTIFGSLSMVLFPLAGHWLQMSPESFGLWSGAAIHEVAQAVAAAFQGGETAGEIGTVAKLGRVVSLAPVILLLSAAKTRRREVGEGRPPVPWFAFGFLAVVLANSALPQGTVLHDHAGSIATFLLTVALAAMGLETDLGKLRAEGLKPFLLGMSAWVFVTMLALGLVLAMGQ